MLIDEPGFPNFHLGAEVTESLLGIVLLYNADYRLDSLGYFAKIYGLHFHRWQAEPLGVFHQMVDVGCPNQGLTGNASEMETVPAQLLFLFHEQCFRAELGCSRRDG
jgi:hypothetical protein